MIAKTTHFLSLMALGCLGLLASANGAGANLSYFSYTNNCGHLLVGIRQPQTSAEIIADLGPAPNFFAGVSAGKTIVVTNYTSATVSAAFSTVDDVFWSVVGLTNISPLTGGASNIVWMTNPRSSVGVQTTPWVRLSANSLASVQIDSIGATMFTYSATKPLDAVKNNANVVINFEDEQAGYGYFAYVQDFSGDPTRAGNFQTSWQGAVENIKNAGSPSRSDIYEVHSVPSGYKGNKTSIYLGYFDMQADGTLTFTATGGAAAPAAPTGITAVATNGGVFIDWAASSGATNYNVKRSLTIGGTYSIVGSATGTNYTDTSAVSGTTYYYEISAVGSGLESANSSPSLGVSPLGLPVRPTLMATVQDKISFSSETGVSYVLLSTNSAGLGAPRAQWPQVGASLPGTGGVVSFSVTPGKTNTFYVVRASRP